MADAVRQPGFLRNLRIKRVSLVDAGANFDPTTGDGAHIMLYKAAPASKSGPTLAQVHVDSPDWDAADQDDYEKADLSAEGRRSLPDSAFAAVWTDAQGKKHRKLPIHDAGHLTAARGRIDGADIPADVKAAARRKIEAAGHRSKSTPNPSPSATKEPTVSKIKSVFKSLLAAINEPDVEKRKAAALALATEVDGIEEPVAKAAHDPDDPMCKCDTCMAKRADVAKAAAAKEKEDLEKAVGVEVAKRMSDIEKRNTDLVAKNAALETSVAKMQEATADAEMTTILKSFKATPFKLDGPESDVVKFRAIKAANPAAWDRMLEVFRATDAQMAESALFGKSLGSGLSGGGNAWAQIEAKADAFMEKNAGSPLSRAQVIEKVMFENPKLVRQHREEEHRAS